MTNRQWFELKQSICAAFKALVWNAARANNDEAEYGAYEWSMMALYPVDWQIQPYDQLND